MLGHSSAGKTTYMAALYHLMGNGLYDYKMWYDKWVNYFYKRYTLNNMYYTINEAEKEELELKRLSIDISNGKYPLSTAIKQEYILKMQYKHYKEIQFNWFDYRGGALMERSSQSDDTASLMTKIKCSDALVVFLDGTKLEEPLSKNEKEFKRLVYLIKATMSCISIESERYFPISFVITKDDLCSDVLNSVGFEYFRKNILDDIIHSNKIAGLVTWTTVDGKHIYNVHWPLFFSIAYCWHKFDDEVVNAYQKREKNRGFFGTIKEMWTDNDKDATTQVRNELKNSAMYLAQIINEKNGNCLYLI